MKKLIVLLILFPSLAFGGPFLICDDPDPMEQLTSYEIYQDGNLITATNDLPLHYDLQGITPDQYSFTAKACNIWGCSELSDPFVSPTMPSKPIGLSLTP